MWTVYNNSLNQRGMPFCFFQQLCVFFTPLLLMPSAFSVNGPMCPNLRRCVGKKGAGIGSGGTGFRLPRASNQLIK